MSLNDTGKLSYVSMGGVVTVQAMSQQMKKSILKVIWGQKVTMQIRVRDSTGHGSAPQGRPEKLL